MGAHDIRNALPGHDLGEALLRAVAWERHPDGDELLHVLEGEVEVTVLTDEGPVHVTVRTGSIFVVPGGSGIGSTRGRF